MGRGSFPFVSAACSGGAAYPGVVIFQGPAVAWMPLSEGGGGVGWSPAGKVPGKPTWQEASLIFSPNSGLLTGWLILLQMQIPRWENQNRCQQPEYGIGFCKSPRKVRMKWWVKTVKGADCRTGTAGCLCTWGTQQHLYCTCSQAHECKHTHTDTHIHRYRW